MGLIGTAAHGAIPCMTNATVTSTGLTEIIRQLAVRVALLECVTKPARDALLPAEQRRRAEFCNMEYRPQPGHEFTANGSRWRITEIDTDGTTPVVTRVWVEFLQRE